MKSFLPSEEYSYAKLPSEFGSTVEPRLTTTPFLRPPRYYGHILSTQT